MDDRKNNSVNSTVTTTHTVSYLLVAWFPAFVVFVLIPFAVYFPNQNEFGGNLIYPSLSAVVAALAFLLVLPLLLLQPQVRARWATVLFFFGVYLALADILAPIQVGDLTSGPGHVKPAEPFFLSIIEAIIFLAAVWAAIRIPTEWTAKIGSLFVIVLVLTQALYFYTNIPQNVVVKWGNHTIYHREARAAVPETLADSGNVYQICFDAYSSLVFLDTVKAVGNKDAFDGFTFYEKNRSNYVFTRASYPSYLTGTYFDGGSAVKWDSNRHDSGMIRAVHHRGYAVSMYTPNVGYYHQSASYARQLIDVIKDQQKTALMFDFKDFIDLCLLRIVPNWLQQELYPDGRGVVSRIFAPTLEKEDKDDEEERRCRSDVVQCLPLVRALIEEEEKRPANGQYVYAHFWFTHNPIGNRNSDCTLNRKGDSTYFDHAVCATRIMERFIMELKRLGRFKNSTIIFQADHGHAAMGPKAPEKYPVPKDVATRIRTVTGIGARYITNKTYALLLVKPAGEYGSPLRISKSPTSLVDLPMTIYQLLGIKEKTEEGRPIFEIGEAEEREIPMFAGFARPGGARTAQMSRMLLLKGELVHFSFTEGKGWKLYPDIPFTKN
jgi:hypothetical protein